MKKNRILANLLFACCILMGLQHATFAQNGMARQGRQDRTPEERASMQTQMLAKQLGLSADQEKQIQPLMLERVKKREELRNASDRKAALLDLQALNKSQEEKIKVIMTPDQYVKYQELQEKMKDRVMDRARERMGNGNK